MAREMDPLMATIVDIARSGAEISMAAARVKSLSEIVAQSRVDLLTETLRYWADRMDGTDGKVSPQTVLDFLAVARSVLTKVSP